MHGLGISGAGDLRQWVGILTPPVEQHEAGGRLGAPPGQPPKGPHYRRQAGRLLWQPDAPPKAASGVQWA